MKRFFPFEFFKKPRYKLKILKKLAIKMYTRLRVRTKIFCCDRNKKLHSYRKNKIIKITILMVTKKKIESS
jgi:hypothetical protein